MDMENLGCSNVMVLTDRNLAKLPVVDVVMDSLQRAGRNPALFDTVEVEPTNQSFQEAIDFAKSQVRARCCHLIAADCMLLASCCST